MIALLHAWDRIVHGRRLLGAYAEREDMRARFIAREFDAHAEGPEAARVSLPRHDLAKG